MKVLITGALGRVARRVIPFLRRSFDLRLTDLSTTVLDGLPVTGVDLLDLQTLCRTIPPVDAIAHFAIASYGSLGHTMGEDALHDYHKRMLKVNVEGTYHIYEAARRLGIPHVVFISSLTIAYGGKEKTDCNINRLACPLNFYACTKLFGEHLASVYWYEHGIRSRILRLGQPYPFGHPSEEKWKQDPYIASWFVTAGDIARAVDAALLAADIGFGIYNVVSPSSHGHVDYANGREIGFTPRDRWEEQEGSASVPPGDSSKAPAR